LHVEDEPTAGFDEYPEVGQRLRMRSFHLAA